MLYMTQTQSSLGLNVLEPMIRLQSHLLVEDHVHPMGLNVNSVLSHELQDVLNSSSVG